MQATLVYGILCSTSTGSVSRSDADEVVASIEVSHHPPAPMPTVRLLTANVAARFSAEKSLVIVPVRWTLTTSAHHEKSGS